MTNATRPLVVKLGGSRFRSGLFVADLARIARASRPIALVTGGGIFADAVRVDQKRLGYSDVAAHRMAILAMHQTAEMAIDSDPRFVAAQSIADFDAAFYGDRVPVWMPIAMCQDDAALPADWTITSDALAARLAEKLDASSVLLIKSCAVDTTATLSDLADAGITDREFPRIVLRARLDWRIVGVQNSGDLACALDGRLPLNRVA